VEVASRSSGSRCNLERLENFTQRLSSSVLIKFADDLRHLSLEAHDLVPSGQALFQSNSLLFVVQELAGLVFEKTRPRNISHMLQVL